MDVEFTGIIPQKDIAQRLAKAGFMLFPNAFPETFGISSLESLLYNTPIITNRFGALEETAIDLACYKMDYAIQLVRHEEQFLHQEPMKVWHQIL